MNDWQPGDLALCLADGVFSNIRKGAIYGVLGVVGGIPWRTGGRDLGLRLDGVRNHGSPLNVVAACFFRKVTPGADIEGIEVERRVPVKGEPAHA